MAQEEVIRLFDAKQIRVVWDSETETYYFSIVDVVQVLTDSTDYQTARKYWNKLKQRLTEEGNQTVTNCHQLKLNAADGKQRLTDVADAARQNLEQRIGRSVISPKRAVHFTTPPDELPLPKPTDELDDITSIE